MATVDIGTKEDLAKELHDLAMRACRMEDTIRHAESILFAIDHGNLLAALPSEDIDQQKHNAATNLLSCLLTEIRRLEEEPGTDLSISLMCRSRDVAGGRFAWTRHLED